MRYRHGFILIWLKLNVLAASQMPGLECPEHGSGRAGQVRNDRSVV